MIGILGGTFDPIHLGHLHIAEELMKILPLTEIRFLPCYQPVHRAAPSSSSHRLKMIELAIADYPSFHVDKRELQRQGPSFMIDTLTSLRQELGKEPLALILGSDAFANIESWKNWQQLTDYCHLVIVDRPNIIATYPKIWHNKITTEIHALESRSAGHIFFADISPNLTSASYIREQIRYHEDTQAYLPNTVHAYIQQHRLYL